MGLTSELECAALHLSGGNPFSDGPARLLKAANCQIDQFHCSVVGWKAPARFLGLAIIGGLINPLQVLGDILVILPSAEVQGMAHQMHDAGLDCGYRGTLR